MSTRTAGRPRLALVAGRGRPEAHRPLVDNPYGLTVAEARAEIRRLAGHGWQLWEIRRRFYRRTS